MNGAIAGLTFNSSDVAILSLNGILETLKSGFSSFLGLLGPIGGWISGLLGLTTTAAATDATNAIAKTALDTTNTGLTVTAITSSGAAISAAIGVSTTAITAAIAASAAAEGSGDVLKLLFAANGGRITGPGTGTSDSIPALLSNGEFVINAKATQQNYDLLSRINSGETVRRFSTAGPVSTTIKPTGAGTVEVTVKEDVRFSDMLEKTYSDLKKLISKFMETPKPNLTLPTVASTTGGAREIADGLEQYLTGNKSVFNRMKGAKTPEKSFEELSKQLTAQDPNFKLNKTMFDTGVAAKLAEASDRLAAFEMQQKDPKSSAWTSVAAKDLATEARKIIAGLLVENIDEIVLEVNSLPNISLRGFMCIPNPDNSANSFNEMAKLLSKYSYLDSLSMGMSDDLELAIERGATLVRVGADIFGKRDYN